VGAVVKRAAGFRVAALERFGAINPDTIRLARTLEAMHAFCQAP